MFFNKSYCIDTSTILILFRADVLQHVVESLPLLVTDIVMDELACGSDFKDICVILSRIPCISGIPEGAFDIGENSVLHAVQLGKAQAVLSDDGALLRYCRKENIEHYSSIMVPFLLYSADILSLAHAQNMQNSIQKTGRFSSWVLRFMDDLWKKVEY